MKKETIMSNTLVVSVSGRGGTQSISLGKRHASDNSRVSGEAVIIYSDPTVGRAVMELKKWLENASRKAPVRMELNGMYAIPASLIKELNVEIGQVDQQFEEDGEYIQKNYDAIKAANRAEVAEAIKKFTNAEQKDILSRFDKNFPSKKMIEGMRRLNISVLVSPWSGEISGLEVLADRAIDDAQDAYKRAVFSELAPVYEALATYYTKSCNGLDIGMKSQNHFTSTLLPDLRDNNEIRRDGFTANIVKILEKAGSRIFEDGMLCYNLVLDILHEAQELNVESVLPNLGKVEVQKLRMATTPHYLLTSSQLEEDMEVRIPVETLLGVET